MMQKAEVDKKWFVLKTEMNITNNKTGHVCSKYCTCVLTIMAPNEQKKRTLKKMLCNN